jgi:hypothetical protein
MTVRSKRERLEARRALSKLMAAALLDMRATNYAGTHLVEVDGLSDHERIGLLADMFHNVPGRMEVAAESDGDYQSILDRLWTETRRDQEAGQRWLSGAVDLHQLDRQSPLFAAWT